MAITDSDQLSFELERFEWRGDDRLEVSGRWYGVRGQRFMRPTLHVRAGGRRRRMIAVLDHKPWPAEEHTAWVAAFAWRGERTGITAARLEVAPDVILELPPPGSAEPGTALTPHRRRPPKAVAPKPAPAPVVVEAPEVPIAELEAERAERARLAAELELARRQLETANARHAGAVERTHDLARLEAELAAASARAEDLTAQLAAANAHADALAARLEAAETSRVAPVQIEPLPRRVRLRSSPHREWGVQTRVAVLAIVVVILGLLLLTITEL